MKHRRTRQLDAIELVVRDARDHPTAAQIHARVLRSMPQVSLGTVYRNLEKLIDNGGAIAVHLDGDVTRYDGRVHAHDHFVCRRCGAINDLLEDLGPEVDTVALARAGYAVAEHTLAVFGLCPDCA